MKRQEIMWTFVCFTLLLFTADVWVSPVPDTGQTKCYPQSRFLVLHQANHFMVRTPNIPAIQCHTPSWMAAANYGTVTK